MSASLWCWPVPPFWMNRAFAPPRASRPPNASLEAHVPPDRCLITDTMQFEYEPEKLINEVKKRPGIWDYECVEYRDKHNRRKLWTEIVNEMNATTNGATKSELRELELQLQRKWKSIRDCFTKYVVNPKRTKRPYIYMKQLQFLLKDTEVQQLPDPDGESSDSDYGRRALRWKRKRLIGIRTDPMEQSDNENDNEADDNNGDDHNDEDFSMQAAVSRFKGNMDEFAFANVEQKSIDNEDCDRMFLLSLLPHLKTVPEEYRLNVKMELMRVLQNANYNYPDNKLV